jgi:hypothetical protein
MTVRHDLRRDDPTDRPSYLSDARLKFSADAIATLRAIARGEIMIERPIIGLLRGLRLVDSSLKLTPAGPAGN